MLDSFFYMFRDKEFWKKYLSLFSIVLIANILINCPEALAQMLDNSKLSSISFIFLFLGLVIMMIPYGYSISALKSTLDKNFSGCLPMLNITKNFKDGFKVVLSGLIFLILLILTIYILFFVNAVFSSFLGSFISIICNILIFLILLIVAFFGIAMCCKYVTCPSYLNFINFKAAYNIINNNVGKYFIAFLLSLLCIVLVYSAIFLTVPFLTEIGYIGLAIYCLFVSALWTYQIFVLARLFSKAIETDKL